MAQVIHSCKTFQFCRIDIFCQKTVLLENFQPALKITGLGLVLLLFLRLLRHPSNCLTAQCLAGKSLKVGKHLFLLGIFSLLCWKWKGSYKFKPPKKTVTGASRITQSPLQIRDHQHFSNGLKSLGTSDILRKGQPNTLCKKNKRKAGGYQD